MKDNNLPEEKKQEWISPKMQKLNFEKTFSEGDPYTDEGGSDYTPT